MAHDLSWKPTVVEEKWHGVTWKLVNPPTAVELGIYRDVDDGFILEIVNIDLDADAPGAGTVELEVNGELIRISYGDAHANINTGLWEKESGE